MSDFQTMALDGASFGAELRFAAPGAAAVLALLDARPRALNEALNAAQGLLLVRGLHDIRDQPSLLVDISRALGEEVEDYRETLIAANQVHEAVPEILVVSNLAPYSKLPPAQPDPPVTADGRLPVQFPHRRGWHSDQSYRRPPPDLSAFYAAMTCPQGQGQTLYASGIAAYRALPPALRERADALVGLHAQPGCGRAEALALAGETPPPLAPHQRPQRQPVVRLHPETGERALFLCEAGQMDWYDGPLEGLEPGPRGAGAKLLYELMAHYTRAEFTYVHDWLPGDLVVYDNRTLIHAATWFDAERHERLMWRTTVRGNPGPEYAGEAPSWIPRQAL